MIFYCKTTYSRLYNNEKKHAHRFQEKLEPFKTFLFEPSLQKIVGLNDQNSHFAAHFQMII